MADWFEAETPVLRHWHSNSQYWRDAIVAEARRLDSTAFRGRNLMRIFLVRPMDSRVVFDSIMVVADVPRVRVVLAAFPSYWGMTAGAGVPLPTDEQLEALRRGQRVHPEEITAIGGDRALREAAAGAEKRVARSLDIHHGGLADPNGDQWSVFVQELTLAPRGFLEADGHTLTELGLMKADQFVRGVVTAGLEWFPSEMRGEISTRVVRVSPMTGPALAESLGEVKVATPVASTSRGRCYVATAVYGSYDAPEVWVLRRWRDEVLLSRRHGRLFVRAYYAISPWLVRKFGQGRWFDRLARPLVASIVVRLRRAGFSDGPYIDR